MGSIKEMHLTTLYLSLTQPLDTVSWVLESQREAMSLLFPFLPSYHPPPPLSSKSLTSLRHPDMRVGEQFGPCRPLCVHAGVSSSAGQPPDPHHVITLMGPQGRATLSLSLPLSYSHSLSLHWRNDLESPLPPRLPRNTAQHEALPLGHFKGKSSLYQTAPGPA